MSTTPYFRLRTIGRAASPPTWACYEQITYHEDDDESESCSEEDEEYEDEDVDEKKGKQGEEGGGGVNGKDKGKGKEEGDGEAGRERERREAGRERREAGRERRRAERKVTLRPILTIQRSQGFVWNQDLFVPAYIKDRYIASTSPPSDTPMNDSELSGKPEVVEIRVDGRGLAGIIP